MKSELALKTINILVAEDNDHDFKQISRAFQQFHIAVAITRCVRAEEVLAMIENDDIAKTFDILITDLTMPGISGLELSEKLIKQGADLPIMLLTGNGDEATAVKAMKLGVDDYLSKDMGASFLELLPDTAIKTIKNYQTRTELKKAEALNKKLSTALEQSRSAVIISDLNRNVSYVNGQYQQLSGYNYDELINHNIFQLMASTTIPNPDMKILWESALSGHSEPCELKKRHKNGEPYWVKLSMTPVMDDNNDVLFMLIVEENIDEQRKIEQLEKDILYRIETETQLRTLKEKEQQAAKDLSLKVKELTFKQSAIDEHAIVSITDIKGNIIYANRKFSEISQYSNSELMGQNHRILKTSFHSDDYFKNMWRTIASGKVWHGEIQNKAKDGSLYWVSTTIAPMLDDKHKPQQYLAIRTDITETKQQQETLQVMAHYDVLTQLPNRVLLIDRFGQAVAHCERTETSLAICFLDLDNFKPINDQYGHKVGDYLLIDVARRIKDSIRDEDTVSRHGGDEFILLLGDIESIYQCELLLDRIVESLSQPYFIEGERIQISASVGYTSYPLDNADLDTLVRHADHAMYEAKLSGRNAYRCFNASDNNASIQKYSHLKAISSAITNNEFCLYYQPKVNMRTGEVYGLEALIRWQHPEKGLLGPIDFLPNINATKTDIEIGDWVINSSLVQMSKWAELGLTVEVSVNISAYHLLSDSFLIKLGEALARHPDVAQNLQLEILETSAVGDLTTINRIITTCQELFGITVALDDFGTGYSSLSHLKKLVVDVIKIDRSFVRDMLDDPNDYAIIDGMIGLADSFHRGLIAEGVESIEHGLMLMNMGCENAQGFVIAQPLAKDKVFDWINSYQPNEQWLGLSHSSVESKKDVLLLFLNAWVSRIELNISMTGDDLVTWPILIVEETPCRQWIKRERANTLFDKEKLNQLDKLNETLTSIANQIFNDYQDGSIEKLNSKIISLRNVFSKMKRLILAIN